MSPRETEPLSNLAGAAAADRSSVRPKVAAGASGVAGFAVDWQVGPGPVRCGEAETAGTAPVPTATDGWLPVQDAADRRGLTCTVGRALGTVVVTARGSLDASGSRMLKAVLRDLIENQGNLSVVVDLHGVTDVDPGCLDVFVTAHGWAIMRGGHLRLAGARRRVEWALEETGVARLVKTRGP